MIRLGIDTGGTYTDAVVIDTDGVSVLAKAKALTTKEDLTQGIAEALDALPSELLACARHAALSTTLATNACVEGKGNRAKLVLVGTNDEVLHRVDAQGKFGIPYDDVITLPFEGSYDGADVTMPDWEALYAANRAFFDEAESFGIASIYALNNGSVVEKGGAEFLRRRFGKLVVEATAVAAKPNVIERGATALLNARLVPVIGEFLDAVTTVFAARGLDLPISIVRSDGSLMSERLARLRPVETILTGPAASVIGAQALVGEPECLVVDMGGTTSDLSIVHDCRPNRTTGVAIGGWKTQVPGVTIDTISLGGDTAVRYTKASRLELGTRRVLPLCVAASRWPSVARSLEYYLAKARADFHSLYELYYLARDPGDVDRLLRAERELVEVLRDGPVSLFDERTHILGLKTDRLEDEGIVMRIGMTPTDAMHILGDFSAFDAEASRLGARCVLKSYRGPDAADCPEMVEKLADEVYGLVQRKLYLQVVATFSQDRYWPEEPSALDNQLAAIAEASWRRCAQDGFASSGRAGTKSSGFSLVPTSSAPLVGVGAPAHVLLGRVASALGAPCVVPEHSEVANAVGAAAAPVHVEETVTVVPQRGSDGVVIGFLVRGTGHAESYDALEDALERARELARALAEQEARRRGAVEGLEYSMEESRNEYGATGVEEMMRNYTVSVRAERRS